MPHAQPAPSPGFQALILCGPGVSLNTFTSSPEEFPKALVPIANRPMVWYPLDWCYRMGVTSKRVFQKCSISVCRHSLTLPISNPILQIETPWRGTVIFPVFILALHISIYIHIHLGKVIFSLIANIVLNLLAFTLCVGEFFGPSFRWRQ